LLQQRSKHAREMAITSQASTSCIDSPPPHDTFGRNDKIEYIDFECCTNLKWCTSCVRFFNRFTHRRLNIRLQEVHHFQLVKYSIFMYSVLLGWTRGLGTNLLKVPCAPKSFSSSFSYSTCTKDFGAATHNERRFQFRLGISRVPSFSVFHG